MASSANTDESIISKVNTAFKNDVIKETLKSTFANPKTKITDDAVDLMTELSKFIVVESCLRAAKQCSSQNRTTVTLNDMESVLPQIMLDFP
nr:PREDICTED: centromere protein X-like isoform X1 [Tribolium castaneum]|eukprot:XP_008195980.1 PREDICTED: centromere protein X-like isoform X1 [Tribolium castaneum]